MKQSLPLFAMLLAAPAFAESSRELDAHEHGVGKLNIAIEGSTVAMEFHAPGADIVGFEYEAESDADKSAIDAALSTLAAPLDLFGMPDAAVCTVSDANAELESEEEHEEHEEHGDEHNDDKDHDAHKDEDHAHSDEDHEAHKDEDHAHEEHAEEAGHTEFHAEYSLNCENPQELTRITFTYFETFPNAKEVEVQIIDTSGARAYEVERDNPILDLDS